MVTALIAGALLFNRPLDFYAYGPYDSSVPRPESILHYGPGERHSTFRELEQVVLGIAGAAKNRVRVIQYGKTAEGRPLRIVVVSSAKNMAHLDEIRSQHLALASGGGDPAKTVPIVWINECIHGDETASFESGMWTLYNLVAARGGDLAKALDNEVVVLNPVYNPDGHERYVVYYNSIATGSDDPNAFEDREPSTIYGRLNHYRFDMNRDRVAFSQDETRAEFAEMLRWNPQVYIDQHGQVGSYFFPPEPMSINPNVDRARNAKWTDIFGRATGKAFDSHGMTYFVKDTFDLYYPGYVDSSNTLTGAIGMTHETDGGRTLARRRGDGSQVTLRNGMEKHFVSALAVVRAASDHAQDLLADYAAFKKRACTGEAAGKFQRVVMTSKDPRPLARIKEQLGHAGITSSYAAPFEQADAHDYWSSKTGRTRFEDSVLVVDMAQPQGAFAKALLQPDSPFEAEFVKEQVAKKGAVPPGEKYPGPDQAEFYDLTGWALPYAHNVRAWWCESAPKVQVLDHFSAKSPATGTSPIGYALRYSDQDDILAVFDALQEGARGMVTTKAMRLASTEYPAGTFLFLAGRNDDGYEKTLEKVAAKRGVRFEPLSSAYPEEGRDAPGSESVRELRKPSIAVVMGSGENLASSGAMWYLMDRVFKLPFAPVNANALANADLSDYTCIVVPRGAGLAKNDHLREWLGRGNVVVAYGNAGWANGFGNGDVTELRGEMRGLPGSLFRAQMDPRSFLSYGYDRPSTGPIEIAVPLQGGRFFEKRTEGGSVVVLSSDEKAQKLLSGWAWPDETEKALRGALFLQDSPSGGGHIVSFADDPTDRAMWPGLYKMLLNGMILGSGG